MRYAFLVCVMICISFSAQTLNAQDKENRQNKEAALPLSAEQGWSRPSDKDQASSAAYMILKNTGKDDIHIVSVESPASETAILRTNIFDADIILMPRIENITVPGNNTHKLAPGGDHVMLMGLHAPLKAGARFPLTLETQTGKTLDVNITVGAAPARIAPMKGIKSEPLPPVQDAEKEIEDKKAPKTEATKDDPAQKSE